MQSSFLLWLLALIPLASHAADSASVSFSLDFPKSDPSHYVITVASDGRATYECTAKIAAESDDTESYKYEFELTAPDRARVFDLASQSHYFSGKVDSGKPKLAFTGAKKLTYTDGQRTTSAEYNYSSQVPVQQLTDLFQKIAATMEFGRRLAHEHRYQKLALDEELKSMEAEAQASRLAEIQAVQPILQAIVEDGSVLNVVRTRAQRLIELGKTGSGQK